MRSRGVAAIAAASLLTTLTGIGTAGAATDGPRITGDGVAGPATRATSPGGTIVLIKDHDVWLVRPDGTGLTRVTRDGTASSPYEAPTMSDTGLIAVARDGAIVLMRQSGQVVGSTKPQDLFLPDAGTMWTTPIIEPVISPDGSRLAYSQLRAIRDFEGRIRTESLTAFADLDGAIHSIEIGYQPSWITRGRAALNGNGDVDLYTIGEEQKTNWFDGDDVMPPEDDPFAWYELSAPEVSPDGELVTFMLAGGRVVGLAALNGSPAAGAPAKPDLASCFVNEDGEPEDPSFDSPSWGPDSRSVAFSTPEGIQVVTDFHLCENGASLADIVPGGSEPDWSGATLDPGPALFTLDRTPSVTGTAKVGKTLTADAGAWTPAPTGVAYRWLRDGKAVKGATGKSYRLVKADRGHRVSVRVTVERAGYRAAVAQSSAKRVR
ncbi:PD40 domain-containing protein [Nocardioides ferulae]|uniref:PD40 domain-containing protein n=1 Tax=Nocardioides ferulae TaxID=2340821 RepID=UPI000EB3421A|nr:PD40 domain-containing protein [Nocardioides ferulae]